jgi:transketolase
MSRFSIRLKKDHVKQSNVNNLSNPTLSQEIGDSDIEMEPNRKGFGRALVAVGETNENVVALCADLTGSVMMDGFAKAYPDRFVEIGVAEQNLITVSSGMAAMGKIPYCASYAAFAPGRCWEQFKTTCALNNQPVKLIGGHAGLYTGPDGATHQMLEDIAIMRAMPNVVVLAPCDSKEAEKATVAMSEDDQPTYMRMTREPIPVITTDSTPFEIGKAQIFNEGTDVSIVATGTMTYHALIAAQKLAKDGISAEVIHCATVKPLDNQTILKSVKKTNAIVTVEEAQIIGGLGGAVAELISENYPVPLRRVGVKDKYGESGAPEELLRAYGLTDTHIILAVHEVINK